MEQSLASKTKDYIDAHPFIKASLKKGIVNYTALSRLIVQELQLNNKTSKEAIIVAARRLRESLRKEIIKDKAIKSLLQNAEIIVRNKMMVVILKKDLPNEKLYDFEKKARQEGLLWYFIEGTEHYLIMLQEKHKQVLEYSLKHWIIKKQGSLALLIVKTSQEIEELPGVLAYLTGLFAEHGINMVECISCWTDTLIVIQSSEINKALTVLKF